MIKLIKQSRTCRMSLTICSYPMMLVFDDMARPIYWLHLNAKTKFLRAKRTKSSKNKHFLKAFWRSDPLYQRKKMKYSQLRNAVRLSKKVRHQLHAPGHRLYLLMDRPRKKRRSASAGIQLCLASSKNHLCIHFRTQV